jgi:hypothetical protein
LSTTGQQYYPRFILRSQIGYGALLNKVFGKWLAQHSGIKAWDKLWRAKAKLKTANEVGINLKVQVRRK